MNIGIYCETIDPQTLIRLQAARLLGRFQVTLGHALRFTEITTPFSPECVFPYLEFAQRLREAGGRFSLWPLVPKPLGYWVNERNLDVVDRAFDAFLESCRRFGAMPDGCVIDVETPWTQMERFALPGRSIPLRVLSLLRFLLESRNPRRFVWSSRRLSEIVRRVQREGIVVSSTVFPLLIADTARDGFFLQDLLEMPIFSVPFDAYNAMIYNSYLPAALPVLIPREAATRFLFEYASVLRRQVGDKAWVTLGSTWEGVIPGNEGKSYRTPCELAADVAATKAAGVKTIWLYCLEGVLFADQALKVRRSPEETAEYFRVLKETPAAEPPPQASWTRNRKVLEWLCRDWRKGSYDWRLFDS